MNQIHAELGAFIDQERDYFDNRDNNLFAMGFGQIVRYRQFLSVIVERYTLCSKDFLGVMKLQNAKFSAGSGSMTPEQIEWYNEWTKLSSLIQLEIESYFLFSKILLDKVARFLEFYFGPERELSLDSHDQLTKNFSLYASKKVLTGKESLERCLAPLKQDIADFRDYQIAHEKSPRTMWGLIYSGTGDVSILRTKLYPKTTENQVQNKSIEVLESDLQAYLRETMVFLQKNRDRSRLSRKAPNNSLKSDAAKLRTLG